MDELTTEQTQGLQKKLRAVTGETFKMLIRGSKYVLETTAFFQTVFRGQAD